MQAARVRMDAAAQNIANTQTEDFHREEVVQQARPDLGGTEATVRRAPEAGNQLEQDVVDQLAAKNSFLANLAVFRAGDKMLGTLIDSKA
jgi:flagellar hook protein FlgE